MNIDLSTEAGQETAKEYIKETLERNTNTNTITDSEKENIHEQNTDTIVGGVTNSSGTNNFTLSGGTSSTKTLTVDESKSISDKVDKVSGSSLVADTEIAKIHSQNTDINLGTLETKSTPINADKVIHRDSEDLDKTKTSTWTQIKAFFKLYFDTLYDAIGSASSVQSNLDTHTTTHPAPTDRDTRNDPAGSASTVQSNLDTHTTTHPAPTDRDTRNDPAGSASTVQSNLDTHTGNTTDAHDIDTKVDKISGSSLVADTEIAKIHEQDTDTNLGTLETKSTPIDADKIIHRDSADEDKVKTSTWTQVKAFLKTYFDTLYNNYTLETHASNHTDGTDDIQSATNAQKGLATATHITAIEGNTAVRHTQNTDTKLDEGGANEVSAIELKALLETLDGGEIT
jgi:hypothetical protein